MIDWNKLQPLYERKAYRIVQKHFKSILSKIPVSNATPNTWEMLIHGNIHIEQIQAMFKEIYTTIGINYGNKVNKELEKTKKANVLFNEALLKEILLFLSNEGTGKIVSVHATLIEEVIKAVKEQLGENATVIELQNAIYNVVSKSQTYFKWQALRIARTETTTASGLAAMHTAQQSDLVLSKTWIAAIDNRTRDDHRGANNQVVDFDDYFIMPSGVKMRFPGAMFNDKGAVPANEVINCRCTVAFIPKRDSDGNLILKR